MPTLEILSGELSGKTYAFQEEAKVGKDDTCLVKLTDPGVSRFHAKIAKRDGALQIEDLGSSNGTYVNFKKRPKGEATTLCDKDIVFFGRTVAKFWVDAPPDADTGGGGGGGGPALTALQATLPEAAVEQILAHVTAQVQVEAIRRMRLHELDDAALESLLQKAR